MAEDQEQSAKTNTLTLLQRVEAITTPDGVDMQALAQVSENIAELNELVGPIAAYELVRCIFAA